MGMRISTAPTGAQWRFDFLRRDCTRRKKNQSKRPLLADNRLTFSQKMKHTLSFGGGRSTIAYNLTTTLARMRKRKVCLQLVAFAADRIIGEDQG